MWPHINALPPCFSPPLDSELFEEKVEFLFVSIRLLFVALAHSGPQWVNVQDLAQILPPLISKFAHGSISLDFKLLADWDSVQDLSYPQHRYSMLSVNASQRNY